MAERLDGKVALVTGGGSGIGQATALIFVREGSKVVVADIDVEGGEETIRLIQALGGDATFVKTDVSKGIEVEALINKTVETYGQLHCAFNNAGIESAGKLTAECTEEEFNRRIAVNLTGVWLCMKYEIQHMLSDGGGSIVNNASAAGLVGIPAHSDYVASKHAVVGMTKTAALEYAQSGIRVNAVCPGGVETPMVKRSFQDTPDLKELAAASGPTGRFGEASEIGEAAVWLCSDAASFVTGIPMPVDGGMVAQ